MLRVFVLLALIVAACGGGSSSPAPTTGGSAAPSAAPTDAAPSAAPTDAAPTGGAPVGSLDPSESDAGIAVRVTLVNDESGGRDGTYDVYAVEANGSECDGSFEDDYTVVAWVDDAPIGQIHRFGISVEHDDVPDSDGQVTDLDQARVSFDFVSESGIGTQYTGDATSEDSGSATVDITRVGDSLTFDFEGVTSAGAAFSGQFLCAEI